MRSIVSAIRLSAIVAFLLLVTGLAQPVPQAINYQGRLADSAGEPLPTADYSLSFSIYDAAQGGNRVWGPQIFDGSTATGHGAKVPVVQGHFNVVLGPSDTANTSIASAFNGNRWIEVTIGNNPPILPRQQILSTPFSFLAQSAQNAQNAAWAGVATNALNSENSAKLGGYDWSSIFPEGSDPSAGRISEAKLPGGVAIPVGGVIIWWGTRATIPEGFEVCDGQVASTPNARLRGAKPNFLDRFPKGAGQQRLDVATAPVSGGSNTIDARRTGGTAITVDQLPSHSHEATYTSGYPIYRNTPAATTETGGFDSGGLYGPTTGHGGLIIGSTGRGQAHDHAIPGHDNQPAFLEVFFIIRVI